MFRKQQLCDIEGRLDILERAQEEDSTASLEEALKLTQDHLEGITAKVQRLTLGLAEGIEKVERKERRIDAVIGRARKQLKEHGFESPGLESEAHELRLVDGAGGDERGVPTVPEELAEPAAQSSSVEGVSVEQLQRARGL